jgi:hypothetical protein
MNELKSEYGKELLEEKQSELVKKIFVTEYEQSFLQEKMDRLEDIMDEAKTELRIIKSKLKEFQ